MNRFAGLAAFMGLSLDQLCQLPAGLVHRLAITLATRNDYLDHISRRAKD